MNLTIKWPENTKHIHLTEIDSTNIFAHNYISKINPSEWTLITTDFQSSGKGQIGRHWHSETTKNILASLIIPHINLKADDIFFLNIVASMAIFRALFGLLGDTLSIKWPNDIYVNDTKIAGILIQNQLYGQMIKNSIIGIGLNVNQVDFPEYIPNPTSLAIERNKFFNRDNILSEVISEMHFLLQKIYLEKEKEILFRQYLNLLYRKNRWYTYKDLEGDLFEGKIIGVQMDGKLIIEKTNGQRKGFNFRELTYI